jgi:hypothetical protein
MLGGGKDAGVKKGQGRQCPSIGKRLLMAILTISYGGRRLDDAEQENIVLMCKERGDAGCHRRYMVATLTKKGIKTIPL